MVLGWPTWYKIQSAIGKPVKHFGIRQFGDRLAIQHDQPPTREGQAILIEVSYHEARVYPFPSQALRWSSWVAGTSTRCTAIANKSRVLGYFVEHAVTLGLDQTRPERAGRVTDHAHHQSGSDRPGVLRQTQAVSLRRCPDQRVFLLHIATRITTSGNAARNSAAVSR